MGHKDTVQALIVAGAALNLQDSVSAVLLLRAFLQLSQYHGLGPSRTCSVLHCLSLLTERIDGAVIRVLS
jgi:hypothetical protein